MTDERLTQLIAEGKTDEQIVAMMESEDFGPRDQMKSTIVTWLKDTWHLGPEADEAAEEAIAIYEEEKGDSIENLARAMEEKIRTTATEKALSIVGGNALDFAIPSLGHWK